ncbi:trypsin alpha-like [Schistocerca americana]|uniref:trypsin alpha-like n=1 Tax=Schistocerca americana TaxID=7009 RepID=UPI001F4F2BC5|nr:trypsin alpha-like [Schistocerca americana]
MLRTVVVVLLAVALCGTTASPLGSPIPGSKLWRSRLDGRIVGGSAVSISQYPWQLYFTISSYWCGASIISSNWALSAAHCVKGASINSMQLRAGSSVRGSGGTVHSIANCHMHESYGDNDDYDIAVLQVSNAFSFGPNVQAVALASSEPPAGTSATVSGWGATSSGDNGASILRAVTVQIVDRDACDRSLGGITSRMICAGVSGGGKDACQGDSGGPLVSGSTQVGIVSFGIGCGLGNFPGVYANVANLRSWIRSTSGV